MKNNKNIKRNRRGRIISVLCLALALVMLALCSCNSEKPASEGSEATGAPVMVKAVRSKIDASVGNYFSVAGLEVVEVDSSTLPEGYITSITEVVGREVLVNILAGEFLTDSMLEAKKEEPEKPDDEPEDVDVETARENGYIVVTDYIRSNGFNDVADDIQKIIDENPQSTIYFPDGKYPISKPIKTSSDPAKAVSLQLSNFAVIKAMDGWDDTAGHMIQLGALDKQYSIDQVGNNYFMSGGVVDGSHIARGISVEGGKETSLRYISIKFVTQGVYIANGEDGESSDVDLETVNIVGVRLPGSIGVLVDGYNNTFTNMRVAGFEVAIKLNGANNILRNLHMLYIYSGNYNYEDSIGFWDTSEGNYYDICYPDNFATGFRTSGHTVSIYNNCYAYWYSSTDGESQKGFVTDGQFNSIVKNYRVDFRSNKVTAFLIVGEGGGTGVVEYPLFERNRCQDNTYQQYLVGKVIWRS